MAYRDHEESEEAGIENSDGDVSDQSCTMMLDPLTRSNGAAIAKNMVMHDASVRKKIRFAKNFLSS